MNHHRALPSNRPLPLPPPCGSFTGPDHGRRRDPGSRAIWNGVAFPAVENLFEFRWRGSRTASCDYVASMDSRERHRTADRSHPPLPGAFSLIRSADPRPDTVHVAPFAHLRTTARVALDSSYKRELVSEWNVRVGSVTISCLRFLRFHFSGAENGTLSF